MTLGTAAELEHDPPARDWTGVQYSAQRLGTIRSAVLGCCFLGITTLVGTNNSVNVPTGANVWRIQDPGTSNGGQPLFPSSGGGFVRRLREEWGLTFEEIASITGVSRKSVHNWMVGRPPRRAHLTRLQEAVEQLGAGMQKSRLAELQVAVTSMSRRTPAERADAFAQRPLRSRPDWLGEFTRKSDMTFRDRIGPSIEDALPEPLRVRMVIPIGVDEGGVSGRR